MVSSVIKKISEARFRALTFTILPLAFVLYKEVEWYSDNKEYFIACVIYDRADQDWSYVIMARDEDYIFKSIKHGHFFKDMESARSEMFNKMIQLANAAIQIHSQGENCPKKKDIFALKSPIEKLNKNFIYLKEDERYSPAKEIIREISFSFIDCDGKFFKDFQLSGFDARIWELYLYVYLNSEYFSFNRDYSSPDYLCSKGDYQVCIEATTVNRPDSEKRNGKEPTESIFDVRPEYNAIKLGRALKNKLSKQYWNKTHVENRPLILAIQSFENLGDSTSIIRYLYGFDYDWNKDEKRDLTIITKKIDFHKHNGREMKSGFYFLPDSEYISAVLFSNSGTISKFNRMGKIAGFGSDRVEMMRWGFCLDRDSNAVFPKEFSFVVTPETYNETWGEGLCMFHNPKAKYPIDPDYFPSISHHFYEDGQFNSFCPDSFNPFWSQTVVSIKE